MFYTFRSGIVEGPTAPSRPARQAGSASGSSRSDGPASAHPRSGAFKACNRCRLYRIKCGDKPCAACRANNAKCVWQNPNESSAATAASSRTSSLSSPRRSRSRTSSPPSAAAPVTVAVAGASEDPSTRIMPSAPPSAPFSSPSDPPARDFRLLLKSVSPGLASDGAWDSNPFPPLPQNAGLWHDIAARVDPATTPLNKAQKTYFARLFWTSCGSFFPLMSEVEFQALFAADWDGLFGNNPIAAAVVDGMTALGTQCGYASGTGGRILGFDAATRAADPHLLRQRSVEYFARCRDRLRDEGARVTIDAIRCYVVLSLYHLQANQLESAYYIVGLGVRRAHMIKLHQTPPPHLGSHEAVGRILTWWMLYWLDIHCSMQLDRPPAVQQSTVTCPLPPDPRDDPLADAMSGQAPWRGIHPSAFTYFSAKLTRAMAEALEGAPSAILQHTSVSALEESAQQLLSNSLKSLEAWRASLPVQLTNSREESSSSSSSSSSLGLDLGTPDWLQRQRMILELRYSNACMLLQRPFVLWNQIPGMSGVVEENLPRTKCLADGAVQHASNMISLLYGAYSKTDIFDGLPMTLQSLWNAAMTLTAHLYVTGGAGSQAVEHAYSLSTALIVLESLSHANPEAVRVYSIISLLASRLQEATGLRIHHHRDSSSGGGGGEQTPAEPDPTFLFSPTDFSGLGDAAALSGLYAPVNTMHQPLLDDANYITAGFDNTLYPGFETLFDDLGGDTHASSSSSQFVGKQS